MAGSKFRIVVFLVLFVAGPAALAIYSATQEGERAEDVGVAYVAAAVFALVALIVLEKTSTGATKVKRRIGYAQIILGADGRLSTSKAVTGLWTMYFVLALVLLTTLTFTSSLTAQQAFGGDWNAYFLLLGGPFAAAVAAKGIVTAKVQKDPTSKTNTDAASETAVATAATTAADATAGDLIMNDNGDTDLVDTQYVLFTAVAVAYFVGTLVMTTIDYLHGSRTDVGLPEIPSALLGLTSLSALTYVGNKTVS
jgi:hypothetical protein